MLSPISQYLAIGKLVALLGALALICWQSSQIHRWHTHYNDEHQAHQRDNDNFHATQRAADAENKADVAAKENQYRKVAENAQDAYARDHAELVRMRQQRDAAAKGSAGSAAPSAPNPTASGPHGDGMQVPPANDVQTKDDAADIELRLMHLQNYVLGVLGVDPNGAPHD